MNVKTLIDIDFKEASDALEYEEEAEATPKPEVNEAVYTEETEYGDWENEETETEAIDLEENNPQQEAIPTAVVDDCGQLSKVLARGGTFSIGNKPFIRGEGGGLNWDKGTPMEFSGMGKWQWTAEDLQEPATFRIYINDETAASGEVMCLISGEEREVEVRFKLTL